MRYMMKQKLWSIGDKFAIKNAQDEDVATVEGKVLSWGDQLTFKDVLGNELAFIKQVVMSWGPTYEIHRGGSIAAVVKKKLFTFMKCEFTVDVPGPDDLTAEGDFLDHEYFFIRGGNNWGHRSFFPAHTADVPEACSGESLARVGRVVTAWLNSRPARPR